MSAAVCRPFFHAAQAEWVAENERRAKLKQCLIIPIEIQVNGNQAAYCRLNHKRQRLFAMVCT
jgi:hypothetical protein